MRCARCGQRIGLGKFCPHCGARAGRLGVARRCALALIVSLVAIIILFRVIAGHQFDGAEDKISSHAVLSDSSLPASSTPKIIDLPKLAFAPVKDVSRVLGKPMRVSPGANMMDWREGDVASAKYRTADCVFLDGRLVSITYKFNSAKRPTNLQDALVSTGLPPQAVMLCPLYPTRRYSLRIPTTGILFAAAGSFST